MNFSLKPRVFLIGFLPGFLFIIGFLFLYKDYNFSSFKDFAKEISVFSGIAIVIMSFIIGQIFDSIRDFFIEGLYWFFLRDKDINWDFFYKSSDDNIDRLDNNYYLFYIVNVNLALCLTALLTMILKDWPHKFHPDFIISQNHLIIVFIGSIIVLLADAFILRKDIARHTNSIDIEGQLPHDNVYTRLVISKIEGVNGVGIIAIKDIPKNTYVFKGDKSKVLWFRKDDLGFDKLPDPIKMLYDDFCIIKKGQEFIKYGCPDSFNNMTISWYLNNSDKPNVACDKNYDFYTLRNILAGEELTVKYDTYSDE